MATDSVRTLYWDASAVVSVLVTEGHSRSSRSRLREGGTHLLSTLAYAEALAAVSRRVRERQAPAATARELRSRLLGEPWRPVTVQPSWATLDEVSRDHALRGADLWHLATALTLRQNIPELLLLTYDGRLHAAAAALGIAA